MSSCVHRGPRAQPTTPPISPVPPYRPTSAPPEASPSRALNQEPPRTPATASAGPQLTRCSREETLCFCSLEGSRRERAWLAGDQSRRGTRRPPTLQIPPHARLHALHAHMRPSAGCVLHGGSKGYRRKGSHPPPLRRGHDCRCWGQGHGSLRQVPRGPAQLTPPSKRARGPPTPLLMPQPAASWVKRTQGCKQEVLPPQSGETTHMLQLWGHSAPQMRTEPPSAPTLCSSAGSGPALLTTPSVPSWQRGARLCPEPSGQTGASDGPTPPQAHAHMHTRTHGCTRVHTCFTRATGAEHAREQVREAP